METNPYEAPKSEIGQSTSTGGTLASPWIRFGAAIVDGLILWPAHWVIQKAFLKTPSVGEVLDAAKAGHPFSPQQLMPSTSSMVLVSVLGMAAFVAINYVFLKNGQTIGKKILKLQIQRRSDGTLLPVTELLLKRVGPIWAVSFASILINPLVNLLLLVDALLIFRPQRNTLHDDIAGTKVVRLDA